MERCPHCGRKHLERIIYNPDTKMAKIGCFRCNIYVEHESYEEAEKIWNERYTFPENANPCKRCGGSGSERSADSFDLDTYPCGDCDGTGVK